MATDCNNNYNTKPPMFEGEDFDYWKDRLESYVLGTDPDLWDLVLDGYTHPVGKDGNKIDRKEMDAQQKKDFMKHHKARSIMLNAIPKVEYEKITNRDTAHDIFESLKMTHEGNAQVKETKAMALIQKYEAFKMEDNESIEAMFSRFQIITAGLRVLDKGYTKADHVKKIIRSLPRRWAPMVTAFKVSKDLNKISLEELISALRSHEIELDENEPQKKGKSVALKTTKKFETNAFQAKEESSEDSESEEDEISMLSRRMNQIWKHRRKKFRNYKKPEDKGETSGHKKFSKRSIICYECKEPGHYKSECPKMQKEKPKKRFEKKKGMMATWDDSESSEAESESDNEHANFALMATTADDSGSEAEPDEVFSEFTRAELVNSLKELLEIKSKLKFKYKKLRKSLASEIEQLKAENSELKENNIKLKDDFQKIQKFPISETASSSEDILKEYDYSFQKFLAKSIDRSKMASMIYGVSGNNRRGIGCESPKGKEAYQQPKSVDEMIITYKPLHKQFEFGHKHDIKYTSCSENFHAKPKLKQNFGNSNQKGPKKIWVPKDKIMYVADVLNSEVETPIMVPGLWMLATYDGKKVYVPKSGT